MQYDFNSFIFHFKQTFECWGNMIVAKNGHLALRNQKNRTRKYFKLNKFSFIWVWYVAPRQHIHDVKHMWNECEVDLNWNIFAENSKNAQCCEKYVSKSKVRHMNMNENKACNLFIVHRKWIFPTQTHACIAHNYRFKPISIYISYKL